MGILLVKKSPNALRVFGRFSKDGGALDHQWGPSIRLSLPLDTFCPYRWSRSRSYEGSAGNLRGSGQDLRDVKRTMFLSRGTFPGLQRSSCCFRPLLFLSSRTGSLKST